MAAKRPRDEFENDASGAFNGKRARISFAAVIREAMMAKTLQNIVVMIEPTLRRVIQEEVEKALRKTLHGLQLSPGPLAAAAQQSPPHGLQVIEVDSERSATPPPPSPRSTLRLLFPKSPPAQIFTNTKVEDEGGNLLQLELAGDDGQLLMALPPSIKIELVMVDGDFPGAGKDDWTAEEFSRSVLKERVGRRPLLTGDVSNVIMRGGKVGLEELTITDNSSWVRGRKFRIGARVAPECCDAAGVRIREALTEPFVVKDHRGELYKKSYPPALTDEVWRLEKIGKDGKFHRRLSESGINTVQEFLKLHAVDSNGLRNILGQGMSEKMWESTVNHAKTCELGTKLYFHRDQQGRATVLLNPVCGVEEAVVDGHRYADGDTYYGPHRAYVEGLVAEAYRRWGELQVLERAPAMMPHADPVQMLFQQPLVLPGAIADANPAPAPLENDVLVPSGYHPAAPLGTSTVFDFDILGSLTEAVQFDFGGAGSGTAAFFQYPTSYQTPVLQQPGNLYGTPEPSSDDESSVSQPVYFPSI